MTATDFVHSPWIPEDDQLLRTSIENGASLQSLAKGAVKFSRNFTLRELRDRWRSLLFDPNVSNQAAAHMVEFELDNLRGEKVPEKRKHGSVRRHYNAMRKRIKNDFLSSQNLRFFDNHQEHKFEGHGTTNDGDTMLDDCLVNSLGFEEKDFEILRQAFPESLGSIPTNATTSTRVPLWKTMEDIRAPDMPVDENNAESHRVVEEALTLHDDTSLPELDGAHLGSILGDRPHGLINCIEYTDSLLNLSNEDDILLMDEDAKDASPNVEIPGNQCSEESKDSLFYDERDVCHQEVNEGEIICTLNTEDSDIPCNDDIFLLIHPSTQFAPSVKPQVATDRIGPLSSSSLEKDGEQGLITKGKDPLSLTQSLTGGLNALPDFVSLHSLAGSAFKYKLPDGEYQGPLPGKANDVGNRSQTMPVHTPLEVNGNGKLEEDASKVEPQGLTSSAMPRETPLPLEVDSVKTTDLAPMDDSYISDNNNNSDSDSDIPYFSDVEATILDMDLLQSDKSYFNSEVAKYRTDDAIRMAMRLEQSARSSFQRIMSSHKALAALSSRHLTHYIKKAEVTIGRSTDDTEVDIDLRKEGRANKISRRQAIIKMETDGSFSLKNLGGSSIAINGEKVAHGEVVALASSSFIDIKGMCFVFDINDKYVRRFLGNKPS
ncbi:putative transcription factor interactor and regulator FHA-SMAD family [Helianthus annuus]|nr:putative transcription factor interactor and regulator FHA-SMAD family [Helianthus annuus]KAJ0563152.1 putative transcription factor interactor and regulator FHA-SMAD family [Helianthus annuus]KAJ0728520.1 putative transcription factor interactor and regulator FHA-SMAD family [Helianthus annuus]KAJ0731271.1 putative transcription factor interactor and regulator FHA-SMAD family [Helianthus annuus]